MDEKKYSFDAIKAVVGLGNPGNKYSKTRHNIGFRIVDNLAGRYGGTWDEKEIYEVAQILVSESEGMLQKSLYLIKPTTFMNNSGRIVPFLMKKGIKPEEILVIHDELEKPFGKINIRWNGGARGHNGLRSISGVIGKEFWRLGFGIGRPEDKDDVGNYVLSSFSRVEEGQIGDLIEKAISIIEL